MSRRVGFVNSVVADLQGNRASAGDARSANLVPAVKPGGGRSTLAPDGLSGQQRRPAVHASCTTSAIRTGKIRRTGFILDRRISALAASVDRQGRRDHAFPRLGHADNPRTNRRRTQRTRSDRVPLICREAAHARPAGNAQDSSRFACKSETPSLRTLRAPTRDFRFSRDGGGMWSWCGGADEPDPGPEEPEG
jgi:hypothetical protein